MKRNVNRSMIMVFSTYLVLSFGYDMIYGTLTRAKLFGMLLMIFGFLVVIMSFSKLYKK